MKRHYLTAVLAMLTTITYAQDKTSAKFGKITPQDFSPKVYSVDSNANAVIIADVGSSQIIGNRKFWFSLEHKTYRRVHILNKNGYDAANVSIYLYTDGENEEKIEDLKAVTYNLENGKVVETKLDAKASVFKEKINKNYVIRKFTFPNVKEGSIIEYQYTKISDFLFNLEPWEFQGDEPRLWSEYNLTLPSFFVYVFISQGFRTFDINTKQSTRQSFTVSDSRGAGASEHANFTDNATEYRWVMKDVPSLKQESFTSTLRNHISKMEFQLTEQRDPLPYHRYLESWSKMTDDLLKAEYFGQQLSRDNGWLNDYTDPVVAKATTPLEKARKIFEYVQENFTCTNYSRYTMDQNLRNVARTRNGNVAEINLLLTAMLRHEKITADPVLLSTRNHGYTYAMYPLPEKFNYVISRVLIDDKEYFLDASRPRLGFGKLDYSCYNGHARVVNAEASPLDLVADSLMERKLTSVILVNSTKGGIEGNLQQSPGYFESYHLRNEMKEKGREHILDDIKKAFTSEIKFSEPSIDSLNRYDEILGIHCDFNIEKTSEDIYYFNPMFAEGVSENPFKSQERFYPVEMPYAMDNTYILRMDVPEGYQLDELPKQTIVKLNEEGDGMFEYRITHSNGVISMRTRLVIKRTYFLPEEYEMLREFFNLVVKKHSEQIVFKKKK